MTPDQPPSDDDLYETLGLGAAATDEEITRAYRRLARERHPDANPDAQGSGFSELTDAYDILHDPDRRRAYDRIRSRGQASAGGAGIRIPVRLVAPTAPRQASGAGRGRGQAGAGEELDLALTFEQACLGTTAVVPVEADWRCQSCAGTGRRDHAPASCPDCAGTGVTTRKSGGIGIRTPCDRCDGRGRLPAEPCPDCDGTGRRHGTREVTIEVPAGVQDGARLRTAAPDADGHLVAVVRVAEHAFFGRQGNDLTLRVPVTLAEAALGAVVTVPTLTGAVTVRVPPGTPDGRVMRLRGRGVPHDQGPGDLLLTIEVVIPAELNDAQRAALEAFSAATDESPRAHLDAHAADEVGRGP